jgi:hypothetical protein
MATKSMELLVKKKYPAGYKNNQSIQTAFQ